MKYITAQQSAVRVTHPWDRAQRRHRLKICVIACVTGTVLGWIVVVACLLLTPVPT